MSMDINATPGTKVSYHNPNAGWASDGKNADVHLLTGEVYTVKKIDIRDWMTHVWLEEIPDVSFNSVMFNHIE